MRRAGAARAGVVATLDEPRGLVQELSALGRRHTDGVVDSQYDTVRVALFDAMAQALGDAFDAEPRAAASETYALAAGRRRGERWRGPKSTGRANGRAPVTRLALRDQACHAAPIGTRSRSRLRFPARIAAASA